MPQEEFTRENPNGPIGSNIKFENDLVRVWDLTVAPLGRKAWHTHKHPYVIVSVSGGKVEIENVAGHTYRVDETAGEIIWRDAGESHELRNLTDAPYKNILVELKQPAKA
jgi:quercetin dioxygenase-like cupin family protein